VDFDQRIAETERDLANLRDRIGALESQEQESQEAINILGEQAKDLLTDLGQKQATKRSLHEAVELSRTEISRLEHDIEHHRQCYEQARADAVKAEALATELHARTQSDEREMRDQEARREQLQEQHMTVREALTGADERLKGLREKHQR